MSRTVLSRVSFCIFHCKKMRKEKYMFVKVKEAARELHVSERFLRKLIAENRVTFYKLSERTTRFDLNELKSYMRHIAKNERLFRKRASDE